MRRLTNDYNLSRLVSLAKLDFASQFAGRDTRGPYVIVQDGYDPDDPAMRVRQFILSRNGEWLDMGWFVRMPVPERRQAFMFATVGEVMGVMQELVGPVRIMGEKSSVGGEEEPVDDEILRTINEGRG